MSDQTRQALFAVALPLGASAALILLLWLAARRRSSESVLTGRLAAWVVPGVTLAGVLASYWFQFRDREGRWQWLIVALAITPVLWASSLMVGRAGRVRAFAASFTFAVGTCVTVGYVAVQTIYPSQAVGYATIVPAAMFALGLVLHPLATRNPTAFDAAAVAVAGLATAAVVVLGQFMGAGELLSPAWVACGVAAVGSLAFRSNEAIRRGLLAGAVGIALLLPVTALVGWLNSYDLGPAMAAAYVLPSAGLVLLWMSRLPFARRRPILWSAVAAGLAVAASIVALTLALSNVDLRAFGITSSDSTDYGY